MSRFTPLRRRRWSSALLICAALALGGCGASDSATTEEGDNMMSLADARAQLEDILRVGAEAAGGEWDLAFDVTPWPCDNQGPTVPDEPHSYAPAAWGPGFEDAEAVATVVAAAWRELGYEVYSIGSGWSRTTSSKCSTPGMRTVCTSASG